MLTDYTVLSRFSKKGPEFWLPILSVLVAVAGDALWRFDGFFGQDAYEYLRQSRVIFERMHGARHPSATMGDYEMASGFPLAGAMMRFLIPDAQLALLTVSWLSAGLAMRFFLLCVRLLTPGAQAVGRWWIGVLFMSAPMMLWAEWVAMSDMLGLMLTLAAFYYGLVAFDDEHTASTFWAGLFGGLAVVTRYGLLGLIGPLMVFIGWQLTLRGRWRVLALLAVAVSLGIGPYFWLKADVLSTPLGHSLARNWTWGHFFQFEFGEVNGVSSYTVPNIVYLFFPLFHPKFCLFLPGLFFLFKRTDLHLSVKKVILVCLVVYGILLAGLPHQNLRYLAPIWAFVLLLLFPAWDRFVCYGLYFFRRLTLSIIGVVLFVQILFTVFTLKTTVKRNQLERAIAAELSGVLPESAVIYAFDLDIALRERLKPARVWVNMWGNPIESAQKGEWVLFNEKQLSAQWEGRLPMTNWRWLNDNFQLETVRLLPEGWTLFQIESPKTPTSGL